MCNKPQFGQRVVVRAWLFRRKQYSHEARKSLFGHALGGYRNFWEAVPYDAPITGIYIGKRTLANGVSWWEDDETGTVFQPTAHFTAYLVALNEHDNPIYVSTEDISWSEKLPDA